MKGVTYKENTLQLNQGDMLVMYTDGVTEAMNQYRQEFTDQRLDYLLSDMSKMNCQQVIEIVKTGITDFVDGTEQSDDITMLMLKRK
jgi:sigma-B regulation protein RsbU (phosphoserine phosphatase)